jgi:hypothetical protein
MAHNAAASDGSPVLCLRALVLARTDLRLQCCPHWQYNHLPSTDGPHRNHPFDASECAELSRRNSVGFKVRRREQRTDAI